MESTGSYWCGLYDELERNGIDVSLANPLKTRLIAEARKIKSDKIDSSVLSDLLRANLIVKSYVPPLGYS
jgi:transposase